MLTKGSHPTRFVKFEDTLMSKVNILNDKTPDVLTLKIVDIFI